MKNLLIASLVAACSTDPKPIDVAIPGTQTLVTEKVNGGAWKKLPGSFDSAANATTYSVEVGDEYELAVVCMRTGERDNGQFVASELFGTSDDPEITLASWEPPNCLIDATGKRDNLPPRVTVTGTFDESMQISVANETAVSVTAGHPFVIKADLGLHDLIAFSDTKLLIQRGLSFSADTTLEPIHVASEGSQLLSIAVDVGADADESALVYNTITTSGGAAYRWFPEDPQGALFAPQEILGAGDEQHFVVDLFDAPGVGHRGFDVSDPVHLLDHPLLPRIASATPHAGRVGASWTPIDGFTRRRRSRRVALAPRKARPRRGSGSSVTARPSSISISRSMATTRAGRCPPIRSWSR